MNEVQRTDYSGSVGLSMIFGIILILSLIGGTYLLNQRGDQARRDKAIAIVNQQIESENAKKAAAEKNKVVNDRSLGANVVTPQVVGGNTTLSTSSDLPVTGPDLPLAQLFGVGILTIFVVSYIRSHRELARYL